MEEKKKKRGTKPIQNILECEFLTRESVVRNLPFLVFLALIAIIYIGNTYYAEKTFQEIEAIKLELKELRYLHITTRSNLMFLSKQTELSKRAQALGLKGITTPPYKIFYTSREFPASKVQE